MPDRFRKFNEAELKEIEYALAVLKPLNHNIYADRLLIEVEHEIEQRRHAEARRRVPA